MKKHLIKISLVGSLLLPMMASPIMALAAASDVELGSSAVISVGGISLNVSGSVNFDAIEVGSGNFTLTLSKGAGLKVTSSDRRTFTVNPTQYEQSFSCSDTQSTLQVGNQIWDTAVSVTVTPQSTICSIGGGGGGASGGGSGGSSAPTVPAQTTAPAITPTSQVVAVAPSVAQPSPIAVSVSPVFNRNLKIGMSSPDVKRLQQLLNSDPDTRIAASGIGSPGQETEYFGSLTKKAVQKFQAKYDIASSGDEKTTGYGAVGPKTMAKLGEVFSQAQPQAQPTAPAVSQPSPVAVAVSPVFARGLDVGAKGEDVKRLQQLLNSDPDTRIAASGVGSLGQETEYFGSLTKKAVQKFQEKYNIAKSGDSGYGYVGPKTRAKLEEVSSQQVAPVETLPSLTPTPTPASTQEGSALQAQIELQISQLMEQIQKLQAEINAAQ